MMSAAHAWGMEHCVLIYLVEGKLLGSVMANTSSNSSSIEEQWIGEKKLGVTVKGLKDAVDNLRAVEGFEVLYSASKSHSMRLVVQVTQINMYI
jgi:hypothetical protein